MMEQMQLEQRLACLEAKEAIRALLGRYQTERSRGVCQDLYDHFWSRREDTSLEVGASGVFQGPRNAAAYYQKDPMPGTFQVYVTGEPEIILSEAGSAQVVWQDIGVELDAGELCPDEAADPDRRRLWTSETEEGKAYQAEWLVRKLRADLLQEAEAWKFWHVQVFELLRCPMDSDFVAWVQCRFDTDGPRLDGQFCSNQPFAPDQPPERMADEPTTTHWQYTWQCNPGQLP